MILRDLLTQYSFVIDNDLSHLNYVHLLAAMAITLALILYYNMRSRPIYLVDFCCYRPPDYLRVPLCNFNEHFEYCGADRESIDFQARVNDRSGIGGEACVPLATHEIPPDESLKSTRDEIEMVLFPILMDLLSKHKVNPKNIDILITNCSLFCPVPSISAMIINKFGFRSNIKSVSLSGMGCSAGIVALSLATDLLKVHKNSLAVVLSMEAMTPNGYCGRKKNMILANALFRMGGAALLLSSKEQDKRVAKYKLNHLVRTHMGADDEAYHAVYQDVDDEGFVGVSLSRTLLRTAGNALKTNISELGPLVLPYTEQVSYAVSILIRKFWPRFRNGKVYVPNFKKSFEHFCIHAGGRAVIDAVEENLRLRKEDAEASRMTLYRFGNTSSSSVWYELCYLEAKGRVKKRDRIWQISFGSGFMCNSAVWECISYLDANEINAWSDRIYLYPVEVPTAN